MTLSEETVNAHYELLGNPQGHGLPFRPFTECFEASETVTAQHILFKDFRPEVPALSKIFFYLMLQKTYGPAHEKDTEGLLGYKLRFKPKAENLESTGVAAIERGA